MRRMNRSVMISSTMLDLEEYRTEVHAGCDRIGFGAQHRMENLGALDANAVEVSLDMVEKADIYICFLAHRYGRHARRILLEDATALIRYHRRHNTSAKLHHTREKRRTLLKSGIDVDRIRSCLDSNFALYC